MADEGKSKLNKGKSGDEVSVSKGKEKEEVKVKVKAKAASTSTTTSDKVKGKAVESKTKAAGESQAVTTGKGKAAVTVAASASASSLSPLSSFGRIFLAGGSAASLTHLITVPLDVVKTRMQTDPGRYPSLNHGLKDIWRTEGVRGLFRGITPTAIGYMLQGGCKFSFYELFKSGAATSLGPDRVDKYKLPVYLAAGAAAEVIGTGLLCPWEAVRIRMVSTPGVAPGMIKAFRTIHAEEGMRGLYKGLGPILGKQVPYTMTQFAAFQYTLELAYGTIAPLVLGRGTTRQSMSSNQQLVISTTAGVAAGVVSAICSHPPDTILSRINMPRQPGAPPATVSSIIKDLGFKGLWRGIGVRCLMVGTISGGMFLTYDGLRVVFGLPPTQALGKK